MMLPLRDSVIVKILEACCVARVKAILFDLNGTIAYMEDSVNMERISECLFSRGYEVSFQPLGAAWSFVSFVDYPRYGYKDWFSFLSRIFWRLKVRVDEKTLGAIVELLESKPYRLYPDATEAVVKAKEHGFKTAIVTTIAHFKFEKAIQPIGRYFDFVMTGYEARCDKSNPKMYKRVLEILGVQPDEATMIGDEPVLDVEFPKRLGMNAMLLDRKGEFRGRFVDASVYDLKEAVEIIIRQCCRS